MGNSHIGPSQSTETTEVISGTKLHPCCSAENPPFVERPTPRLAKFITASQYHEFVRPVNDDLRALHKTTRVLLFAIIFMGTAPQILIQGILNPMGAFDGPKEGAHADDWRRNCVESMRPAIKGVFDMCPTSCARSDSKQTAARACECGLERDAASINEWTRNATTAALRPCGPELPFSRASCSSQPCADALQRYLQTRLAFGGWEANEHNHDVCGEMSVDGEDGETRAWARRSWETAGTVVAFHEMTEVCAPKMEYPKCDDVEACKKKEGEGDDRVPWWLVMILIMIPSVLLLVGLLLCKTVSTHTKIAKYVREWGNSGSAPKGVSCQFFGGDKHNAPKLVFTLPQESVAIGVPMMAVPGAHVQLPVAQIALPAAIASGSCPKCGGALQSGWVACPACGQQL